MCYCTPYIEYLGEGDGSSDSTLGMPPTILESPFLIGFHFAPVPDDDASNASNGRCWHDMFRNPVVVTGYPISRRTVTQTGVEMPLNMMARMVRTDHITPFGSTWFFKGFSSMLALTECRDDLLFWHHIYDPNGGLCTSPSRPICRTPMLLHATLQSIKRVNLELPTSETARVTFNK
ncbi:hypothetical protein F5883DRAFT_585796 [Diaporthe sp. PMI_573]|nr:hypothetical protein F5883DRAFT_585796 [Diaporthaceae sp. PMI_573]